MEEETKEETIDFLRRKVVSSMMWGKTLVLWSDKMQPDWVNEWNGSPSDFPIETICDFKQWRDRDTYMKIVRKDENMSHTGHEGRFQMNDLFTIIFLHTYVDDEYTKTVLDRTPGSENMLKFIVENPQRE